MIVGLMLFIIGILIIARNMHSKVAWVFVAVGLVLIALPARAHDKGQWENADPVVREWFHGLMRPDAPESSCCGEADAYWADEVHVRDGKTYATITDDRDDAPLKRPHIPTGTEVEIPDAKLKWDRGNPTGHNVIFLTPSLFVWCFVQGTGI